MITASIDVTLLDKRKFNEVTRANGKKAVFCELVLIETPGGQYGDYMVKQGSTKEERAAKVQMPILGNAKIFKRKVQAPAAPAAKAPSSESDSSDGDFVPF